MCGIAGLFRPGGLSGSEREGMVAKMATRLTHRGPDDAGTWIDAEAGIAIGHRRLAVLDLSPAGHQPMISGSGRYVLALNGEIYNHLEIRGDLEGSGYGAGWRGRSDTETLLAAIDQWGLDSALAKSVGMFAIALWDRQCRQLTLARDRMGEKPLYYGWQGSVFLFASELKALNAHPEFKRELDLDALARYMRRGYIEAPYSVYRGIGKLPPGTYAQLSVSDSTGDPPKVTRYWSLHNMVESGLANPFAGSERESVDALESELARAVSQQCVADVPLGAFLSGGTDSSAVVALMQAQTTQRIKTFTIGFAEAEFQESEYAKAVAQHLGTDHTELYVTPREAMRVVPELPLWYDEPFGDSSTIPTYLVAQLARTAVTVSLSGDGGDELFGGYRRYRRTEEIWSVLRRIPYAARKALSRVMKAMAGGAPRKALYLDAEGLSQCYEVQTLLRSDEPSIVVGCSNASVATGVAPNIVGASSYDTMMYTDTMSYLPDDILVKLDRAAMAVSLETRVPMLDHRVVEFAWRLPLHMKVHQRTQKHVLKRVLGRYVPSALVDRPKMGFGVPVGQWLRGPLREWAENLLSEERLRSDGLLDVRRVRAQWLQHVAGQSREVDSLWAVVMFQAWRAAECARSA